MSPDSPAVIARVALENDADTTEVVGGACRRYADINTSTTFCESVRLCPICQDRYSRSVRSTRSSRAS